jgi:hypothetical protein
MEAGANPSMETGPDLRREAEAGVEGAGVWANELASSIHEGYVLSRIVIYK